MNEITDIVVTLPISEGGLVHLGEKQVAYQYNEMPYWEMGRRPALTGERCLTPDSKVFILTEGFIRGYFEINDYSWDDEDYPQYFIIEFNNNSWQSIVLIPKTGFQSFRYRNFEYEISNN